ncbi:MAG: LysM peptidoglycan-binding domain-containing protein [Actinoplanes sp.]
MDRRSVMARHHVMDRHSVMGGRSVMVGGGVRRPQPPLRLTRRGRAVVLGLLVVVASLCSAVLFTTASRAEGEPAGPPPTHVVQPGDTLWDIAAQQMPRQDGQRAVDELRRLNDMPDYAVAPGEILILPRAS